MNQRLSLTIIAVLFAFSFQQYDIDLSKYTEGSVEADVMNCINNKDTSTCSQVPMKSGIYQCCRTRITIKYYSSYYNSYQNGWIYDMCNIWISQDFTQDQIESMQGSYQEAITFFSIVYNLHIPNYKIEYTCPKNSYTLNYGQGSFTQEEIDIIKSENYCLRLYYEGLYQLGYVSDFVTKERTITKDICMNGLTLPNSKNSCGYASFNFKLADGTTKTVSTCMMLSSAFYETKNLDKLLEEDFKQFNSFGDESIVSFDVEMTNKDGKVLSYNSLTGIVTDPKNDAKYLYKSLLFLFGLLISLL